MYKSPSDARFQEIVWEELNRKGKETNGTERKEQEDEQQRRQQQQQTQQQKRR